MIIDRDLIRLHRDPAVIDSAAVVDPAIVDPAKVAVVDPAIVDPAKIAVVDPAPKSASTTLDLNKAINAPPIEGAFVIPDAFKDRPYLKGVDSLDKLYAMLDGAQTLLGKKGPTIPTADAPQAEKDAYYEAIGRPKTAEQYKFEGADKADPKFLPRLQKAFHKNGLSQDVANSVYKDVNLELQEWMKEKNLVETQLDIDFTKLASDNFGADRDNVMARGKTLLGELASPTMKDAVAKLDNNALIVIADLMRNVDRKYIKQDGPPNQKPVLTGGTPDELRGKARGLMAEQAKHPAMSTEFLNLQTQIDSIYDQLKKSGVKL